MDGRGAPPADRVVGNHTQNQGATLPGRRVARQSAAAAAAAAVL